VKAEKGCPTQWRLAGGERTEGSRVETRARETGGVRIWCSATTGAGESREKGRVRAHKFNAQRNRRQISREIGWESSRNAIKGEQTRSERGGVGDTDVFSQRQQPLHAICIDVVCQAPLGRQIGSRKDPRNEI
jgi:hypothetical protein